MPVEELTPLPCDDERGDRTSALLAARRAASRSPCPVADRRSGRLWTLFLKNIKLASHPHVLSRINSGAIHAAADPTPMSIAG